MCKITLVNKTTGEIKVVEVGEASLSAFIVTIDFQRFFVDSVEEPFDEFFGNDEVDIKAV